jgi:heterodisulfide reductase subunit A-like polyferredoxin
MAAEDYLRMYIAKVKGMGPLEPFHPEEEINKDILVVGGGVAGLTAAVEAAEAGYDVRLVEKAEALGGWLAKQHMSIPTVTPFQDLEPRESMSSSSRWRGTRGSTSTLRPTPARLLAPPGSST